MNDPNVTERYPTLSKLKAELTAKHRRTSDIQFGTLHGLPTLLSTPNAHAIFLAFGVAS